MNDDTLLQLLHDTASAVADGLDGVTDWGLAGTRRGQHHSDLAADDAALEVLGRAPVGVLSEESGLHDGDHDLVVVIDPLDGSTNAHRGLPWFATSLCAVDRDGPRAAVVNNLITSQRFTASRGAGAALDGSPIESSTCTRPDEAIVGLSGWPPHHLGWAQFRVLGAVALDLCAVASGVLDGFVDCSVDAHGPWDYLGALLICREVGVPVVDAAGRDLVVLDHGARRTPIAGATAPLLEHLVQERQQWPVESVNASSG